jgi:predicted permease
MFSDWMLRLRSLFRRAAVEQDIDDELRFHFDRQVESYIAKGFEKAEAARQVRLEFGGVDQVKEEYRDALGVRLVDDLSREMRYVIRTLWKTPAFSAVAILTLALAVAANSAIFSAVYAVLLKPLPISDPGDLVVFWATDASRNRPVVELSYRNVQDWQTESRSFVSVAAVGSSNWSAVMYGRGEPTRVQIAAVTASFFETLGAHPFLGRTFRIVDDVPNAAGVVVLNYGAWVRRFGADPRVVGTTLTLDQRLHTIVGVMPQGFDFPRNAEFWLPVVPILAASSAEWGGDALADVGVLFGLGRLQNDITPVVLAQELDRLASREQRAGSPSFGSSVTVTPFLDYLLGPVRRALWMLFAAVGALLLIACANISALMLTRMTLRRREHAVRIALGANRFDLSRLCVLETAALSIAGGIVGLAVSRWIAAAIVTLGPDDVPRLAEVSINVPVAAFTCGAVFLSALFCAVGPVRQAGASDLLDALKDGGHTTPGKRSQRTRSLLLTIQVALAVVLLISAGLIVRSFANLRTIDLGFTPQDVITMSVRPSAAKSAANDWFGELLSRIATLPQVEAAGAVYLPPLALGPIGQDAQVILDGQPDTPQVRRSNPTLNYQVATPGYFRAMGISLVRGRVFEARDDRRAPPVAIVGETTARRLWPGEDPIGKRLAMPTFAPGENVAGHVKPRKSGPTSLGAPA